MSTANSSVSWRMRFKQLVKKSLPESWLLAYRTWRYTRQLVSPQLLRAFKNAYPHAFFIQIGSNDGEQLDPLRAVIIKHDWHGIMIEPVPYVFERLRQNYGRYSERIRLENVAIADRDGHLPFYHLSRVNDFEKEGLPRWYDALGSFRKDIVLKHVNFIPDIAQRLICTEVESLSFDSLCQRNNVKQLDLLHMDTEGYDFELLKLIDFTRYRPRLLIYEHLHLTEAERVACQEYLARHGYIAIEEIMDTWCLNLRDLSPQDRKLAELWNKLQRKS